MTQMKLSEFKAKVQPFDETVECDAEYKEGVLTVRGLSQEQATRLLTGTVLVLAGKSATGKGPEESAPKPSKKPQAATEPPKETKPPETVAAPASTNGSAAKTNGTAKPVETKPEPKSSAEAQEPAAEVAAANETDSNLDGELPQEIIEAKRLKDVLVFLQDRGFRTAPQLTAACEQLKGRVGCLSKIHNMGERVELALTAFFPPG